MAEAEENNVTKALQKMGKMGIFQHMKVSATELANDSKGVLDRVIQRSETAEVQRHGKTVVEIRRKVGVSRREVLDLFRLVTFTKKETRELKKAMDAASQVVGYAGGD